MATRHLAAKSTSWSILTAQAGVDGGGRLTVRRTAAPVGRERVVVKVWGAARPPPRPPSTHLNPSTHSGLTGTAPPTSPGPGAGESWRQGGQVCYQQMVESQTKMHQVGVHGEHLISCLSKSFLHFSKRSHNQSEKSSFQSNTC